MAYIYLGGGESIPSVVPPGHATVFHVQYRTIKRTNIYVPAVFRSALCRIFVSVVATKNIVQNLQLSF